jgi:hypothetical protein
MRVQQALPSDSTSHDLASRVTARKNRLLVAGVALVGASLIAVSPIIPSLPDVQHRAVQLTTTELDWADVLGTAETNLQTLETEAATANSDLSSAFSALSTEFSGQSTDAITGPNGFDVGVENSLFGGWYGSDDGYVFGLFGGEPVLGGPDAVAPTGSTLTEISTALQSGDTVSAFSYLDTYFLETLDHTLKPLLSPVLDETSKGATTLSIPVELSQIQTNLLETFGNYTELKALGDALLAPELSLGFGLSQDVGGIATDLSGGDYSQALTDLNNLPSDLTGDLLNGYPTGAEAFTGLLTPGTVADPGSLLDDLLVVWPEQLGTALGESTTSTAAESVSTTFPDLLGGLL